MINYNTRTMQLRINNMGYIHPFLQALKNTHILGDYWFNWDVIECRAYTEGEQ